MRGLRLRDHVNLYLAPGAILKADEDIKNYAASERLNKNGSTLLPLLTIDDATDVTIRGRGVVDASGVALMDLFSREPPVFLPQSQKHPRRRIITAGADGISRNVEINGIVARDGTGWSIDLVKIEGVKVQNVKVLNHCDIRWKIQNDGINATSASDALINQCFVMTIDDAMCAKARYKEAGSMDNVRFSNNVAWTWCAGAKYGMQNCHPMNRVVFENIDILHCRRALAADTKTSRRRQGRAIPIENLRFDRIRAEAVVGHWNDAKTYAVEFDLREGPVSDVRISNFSCLKKLPIRFRGDYPAEGVRFHNFLMDGTTITAASQVNVQGEEAVRGLRFTVDPQ